MNKLRDMPFPRKIPIGKVCEFLFDACLLAGFGIQAFVAGCLLIYGSLPLPPEWMNREISRKAEGFTIEAARYELTTKGKLVVGDLRVFHDSTEQPLLEADFLVAELSRGPSSPARPVIEDIVLSGARLYLPARHAPDGRRSVLLDKLSLRAKPSETGFEIDNVAALHEDIRLRGSVSWPRDLIPGEDRPKDAVPRDPGRFFRTVGEILQAKEKFDVLVRPTLQFSLSPHETGWLRIRATLSGRRLEHPALRGEDLFVDLELRHDGNAMAFTSAPVFSASELESRQHPIRAANVTGTLEGENWTSLQNGGVPPLAFASDRLEVFGVRLSDSRLDIDPVEYPSLRFRGTTSGLRGGAAVSGIVDLQRRKGRIEADGSLDLQRFLPSELAARLPELRFREIPDYRLTIDLGDDFSIDDARLQARVNDLAVNGILLDHVHATLALDRDRLRIKRVHIDRGKQWIDFGYLLERETRSYDLTIRGSGVPTDYNPILPGWWSRLFEDFSFGDDRSAVCIRQGLRVHEIQVYANVDNMTLAGRVAELLNTWRWDACFVDAGRGEGVIDRLRQLGFARVFEINFGAKPDDPHYQDKRTEMWFRMRDWIEQGGWIPNTGTLKTDLTGPTYEFMASGKVRLEPKDRMKERGLRSTDLGDALALTFAMQVAPRDRLARQQRYAVMD